LYSDSRNSSVTNFFPDWAGPPAPDTVIKSDGLTRAALENGVGGAFYPILLVLLKEGTEPLCYFRAQMDKLISRDAIFFRDGGSSRCRRNEPHLTRLR
jgi:hypothetical protein